MAPPNQRGNGNRQSPEEHDAGLDRAFGHMVTPILGRLVKSGIEAAGEDFAGQDVPRFIALVAWIFTQRFVDKAKEKTKINLRPWAPQGGRWILNLLFIALKQVTPPPSLRQSWAGKLAKPLDIAWDGLIDGMRIRANDLLRDWSPRMTDEERMVLMDPVAYKRAEEFVDKFFPTDATIEGTPTVKVDGVTQVLSGFGPNPSYDIYVRDLQESADEAQRTEGVELEILWQRFCRELPEHAAVLGASSLLGYEKAIDITASLRAQNNDRVIDDPENPGTKISSQHYRLKAHAAMAKKRLAAHPLDLVKPAKKKEPAFEPPHPGMRLVDDRRKALAEFERQHGVNNRPFGDLSRFRMPFLIALVAALITLGIAFAAADPPPPDPRTAVTRTRVSRVAPRATKNLRVTTPNTINHQPNINRRRTDAQAQKEVRHGG